MRRIGGEGPFLHEVQREQPESAFITFRFEALGQQAGGPEGVEARGTVTFWHAMSGSRGGVVEDLVADFNAEFPAIKVDAVYSGSYAETVTKGLAAVKAGAPPVLLQSYEVGTQTMIDSGAIIPVFNLNRGEVDMNDVVAPIKRYYSVGGKM